MKYLYVLIKPNNLFVVFKSSKSCHQSWKLHISLSIGETERLQSHFLDCLNTQTGNDNLFGQREFNITLTSGWIALQLDVDRVFAIKAVTF